ncbi:MAG: glycosyltransferase family 39 protein [Elusimicrobia bacterium]|nr:glycosyltransferase family 39 protein [Elusimicrobiota bacterium]
MKRKAAVFAVLGALYILCRRAYYVGFFNDDAFYIIGARSLLSGSYSQLNAPGSPPLASYMPGYSMMLAPLAWLFPGRLWPFQFFSMGLVLTSLWLLWDCFSGFLEPRELAAATFVSGLSPLFLSMSGTVLSEIPFLFLTAVIFSIARRKWESRSPGFWAWFALLMGFACLVRPTGLALVAGVVVALALEARARESFFCLCLGLAPFLLFLARNAHLTGRGLLYFTEFAASARGAEGLASFWTIFKANLAFYGKFLFVTTMFRWPWVWGWLEAATIGTGAALAALGAKAWAKSGWRRFAGLYLLFFFTAHLFWSKQAGRYLFPVIPFAAVFLIKGAGDTGARFGRGGAAAFAAAIVSLALAMAPARRIAAASLLWERSPVNTPPERTLDWIARRTAPGDIFAAELDGRFYLLSGRQVLHWPRLEDSRSLHYWLKSNGARYAAVFPAEFIMRTRSGRTAHDPMSLEDLNRMFSDASRYEKVFEDAGEGTAIYCVK